MSSLPNPAPMVTTTTEAFWAATAEGRFLLQRCVDCNNTIWFPRRVCTNCYGENISTFDASGKGTVYSFTIVRKGQGDYKGAAPYVYGYVELEEGPRVLTNIVDCDVEAVKIGMPVEIVFHDTGEGNALYRFRPAS